MNRDLVCIYTGQGAIGDLTQTGIFTGQFSSCSPVLMYNDASFMGGLYHLPGSSGDAEKIMTNYWPDLCYMVDKIEPTEIILFPAGDYTAKQQFIDSIKQNTAPPGGLENIPSCEIDFEKAEEKPESWREDAGGIVNGAKMLAFERIMRGDQKVLKRAFVQAKTSLNMSYNVQKYKPAGQHTAFKGIQVWIDDSCALQIRSQLQTPAPGTIYDLKKQRFPPHYLCTIVNPAINYDLWHGATL